MHMRTFKNMGSVSSIFFKKYFKTAVIALMPVLFFCSGVHCAFAYTNLLVNPGAETGDMTGWTVDSNGGDGWNEGWNGAHSDTHSFSTSYDWDTRHQTVDLVAAGYTPTQLDSGTFNAALSEWLTTRGDSGGYYYLNFELLAADGTTVLASYNAGSQGSPISLSNGVAWFQASHTFSNIPSGTRYVYFGDGGYSANWWAGNYGTTFDDASVVVADTPFYYLSYAPGANGSLAGTITQTLSNGSSGTAVTPIPAAGYHFVNWSDGSTENPRTDTDVTGNISVTANFSNAPVISDVASVPGQTSAAITWNTATDSSSIVVYGFTDSYGTTTPEIDTSPRVTSHAVTISGLSCNTNYYFNVESNDASSDLGQGSGSSFRTAACPVAPAVAPPHHSMLVSISPTAFSSAPGGSPNLDFFVNGGISHTAFPAVKLSFNADPKTVTGYAVSLDPTFANGGIQSYAGAATVDTFQLPNKPGSYTLYMEYFSSTGNHSSPISHTIVYQPNDLPVSTQDIPVSNANSSGAFTHTLNLGAEGSDIVTLQTLLIKDGDLTLPAGASHGYFGILTQKALEAFQIKYGIVASGAQGHGTFGPKTRAKANMLAN